jgi:four helix bundle protein
MPVKNYKELIVWQKSIKLAHEVYNISKKFPKNEMYGLTSQMQRAAVSIPSNIAEGQARNHRKEFVQFLGIAYGSSAELETQLLIAKQEYSELSFDTIENLLIEIQKMLNTLIQRLSNH